MSEHFNRLTPAEAERLAMLAEEAAEIVQIVGKILRHGYESHHPDDPEQTSNRRLLEREIGDFFGIFYVMASHQDLILARVCDHEEMCWGRKLKFTHHQGDGQ